MIEALAGDGHDAEVRVCLPAPADQSGAHVKRRVIAFALGSPRAWPLDPVTRRC